jgi:hypothetical protein
VTGWQAALPTRLGVAAVVGALTGGTGLLAGHLMPLPHVAVGCDPPGGMGCVIAASTTDILLSVLLWLVVVCGATYVVGVVLAGLSELAIRVPLGITAPLAWPVTLWAIATLLKPLGVNTFLTNASVVGYVALAVTVTATLTAPQVRLAARLVVTGVLAGAVLVVLLV